MKIAVLGGGNGSYAAAADLSEAGHEVRFWRRDGAALEPVRASGTIRIRDFEGVRDVKIALPTADIGEAVRGAELIVAPVPAFAQARSRHRTGAASDRRAGDLSAAGHVRLLSDDEGAARTRLPRRCRHCRDRHSAVARPQARPQRGRDHDPRHAAADRRVSGAAVGDGAQGDFGGVSGRDRTGRGRAVGGLDERRPDHPSAADHHECRADRALRSLGHPQRRHAAVDPARSRCARRRADRLARKAGLSARRISRWPTTTTRRTGCTASWRTTSWSIPAIGTNISI